MNLEPRIKHGDSLALKAEVESKAAEREEIQRQTDEFLLNGGQITVAEGGERGTENIDNVKERSRAYKDLTFGKGKSNG